MSRPAEPRRDPRQLLGRAGEAAAEASLVEDGYRVLERRYRCRRGEIDLIVERDDVVVFVEVKSRSGARHGVPADSVTPAKQRRLALVALEFLTRRGWGERQTRFDVVEVLANPSDEPPKVVRIEDAFRIRTAYSGRASW